MKAHHAVRSKTLLAAPGLGLTLGVGVAVPVSPRAEQGKPRFGGA